MDNNEICKQVKQNIELLINNKKFDEAKTLINEYKKMVPDDIEIYSMEGIIFMTQGKFNEAEEILKHGLDIDSCNFDLSYNLAYVYGEQKKYDDSLKYYEQALKNCSDENIKKEIEVVISKLENEHDAKVKKSKGRIIFFDKGDDKFIWGIINELSQEYETKHIRVTNYHQIDEGMQWADICWFEWCDELVIYGSKLPIAKEKKIICRLHRYEAFTNYIYNVNWNSVDKVIFVAKHIRDIVINKIKLPINKCEVIPNGINLNKFKYYEHKKGFNLAWIGYLNLRKNPMLVLQCFYELVKMDKRYQLYFAGSFQDESLHYYVKDIVKKLNLESNVHFDGFIDNDKMSGWLKNKNYIVTGSIAEGHPVGVMEAMASGLKPVIHYFPGVECFYPNKYIYLNKFDFIKMITENDYNSKKYREFIEDNYPLKMQISKTKNLIDECESKQINNESQNGNFCIELRNKLSKNVIFDDINDMTMIMPTYNRAKILKYDLERGFKLGQQRKIIVDDCSNEDNKNILRMIENDKKCGIEKIIFNEKNEGVAKAIKSALNIVKTKYTTFSGDDDIILNFDRNSFKENLKLIGNEYGLVVPRYVLNLDEEGKITVGYDRIKFNNVQCKDLLISISMTGEIYVFNAGAVFMTKDLFDSAADEIFRVSEDYVMLSRVLSKNLNKKVKVTENYLYIRRISNNTLSKKMNKEKLSLHLLSLLISGYYCCEKKLTTIDYVMDAIKQRGELLQKIYGYGLKFSEIINMYISNKLKLEEFINIINKNNIIKNLTIEKIPIEIIKIKDYYLKEGK